MNSFMKIIIKILLILSLSSLSYVVTAQNSSGTPYSMYGFGLLKDNYGPYSSMGGVSAAMRDNNNINFLNPASYTALDSNRFYFQLGMDGEYVRISTHSENSNYRIAQNAAFNIALRLARNLYTSIGFNQRSSLGYDLYYYNLIGGSKNEYYDQHIFGQGGLNDFYLGLAYKFGNLSIGVNSIIIFGNIERRLTLYPIVSDSYYINTQTKVSVADAIFDLGAQYGFLISPISRITLGANLNLPTKLNADKDFVSYKVNATTGVQTTIDKEDLNEGNISYPLRVTGGMQYEYKDKWFVAADYTYQQMSQYEEFGRNQEFNDYQKGALGLTFLPARNGRFWWQRNKYNAGLYAVRSQLELNDIKIKTIGFTFGTQMPVKISDKDLTLGVAIDLGVRGTEENGLIQERYVKLRLNIAFKEQWFMKRKIY
jgi:long-subunit fatty acid transport protein